MRFRKSNRFVRIVSLALSFCFMAGLFPSQAFAVGSTAEDVFFDEFIPQVEGVDEVTGVDTVYDVQVTPIESPGIMLLADGEDDPTLWDAPDDQYTPDGEEPVYLYVDYRNTDGHPIRASHMCEEGATLENETVKATADTDGYVRYTCDTCGAYAQVNVPALTLDAFELDAAYEDDIENGVEYTGSAYTILYNVVESYQRFVGASLTNNVEITDCGRYHVIITINNAVYDNVQLETVDYLTVSPKPIPWTASFESKTYDGLSLLDGVTVSYEDVDGNTVDTQLTAYALKNEAGTLKTDVNTVISSPVAAGVYAIRSTISDANYTWSYNGGTYRSIDSQVWIFPKAEEIYVDDPITKVALVTGNSGYCSFTLDTTYSGFDSSDPGETHVRVIASDSNGVALASTVIPVTVVPRQILSVAPVTVNGSVGDEFTALDMPDTVTVTAQGDGETITVSGVPVIWDSYSYDSSLLTQTVPGSLDLTDFPQLSSTDVPSFSARINLSNGAVTTPTINPYTKTYDGFASDLPLPESLDGVASMNVKYKGVSSAGEVYESTIPPVNAGSYSATVTFTMEPGYEQLASMTIPYTINKAPQVCPAPTLASSTPTSLILNEVENAEYSKDGVTWQSSPEFKNLDSGATYTLYQRIKATSDGNYSQSDVVYGQFTTGETVVDVPDLQPQTYPYSGNPIAYQVPAISLVTQTTVTYTVDGTQTTVAPTNAGVYPVVVSFVMQTGAAQLDPIASTLTIEKIDQAAPAAPRASNIGTNSITVTAIPGAVFSIDGGANWQSSTIFETLTPDTAYTVLAKYPQDNNHYESPTSSAVISTIKQSSSAGTVQSAVYTYDGTQKSLVADRPLGCTEVIQTFTGTGDTNYGPTTVAPIDPGTYKVKVTYSMASGYAEVQPQYANMTINKATPSTPLAPVVLDYTDSSITIEVEPGMAYSIDGGVTWQMTDTFSNLTRNTSYEIKVKAVETSLYKELEGPSTYQRTKKTVVTFTGFADQTVEYTGHAQTYTLPMSVTGITSMAITGYDGIASAPVTVGDYTVNIDFVAADGYELPTVLPAPILHITRVATPINPSLQDETVTYSGSAQRYHGADGIDGVSSLVATYVGINGTSYAETTVAPTNAGMYAVTVEFSPDANHTMADGPFTAILTIKKAAQDIPMASLEDAASDSLTVSAIPGAEYSIDGGTTWQDSNTFTGLDACKSYTILVRMKEDENHLASGARPVIGKTSETPVGLPDMPAFVTTYNGNGQPYPNTGLLSDLDGVKTVSVMYVGTLTNGKAYESSEAPVNAGTYRVRFYLVPEVNYELSAEQVFADMTINRAPQTMDIQPTIARRTTTTIALNPVPGAEYSIDGGTTWQTSPKFTGLTPNTTYTFFQRLAETDNYLASDPASVNGKTFADTGLVYDVDYRNETIHFDPNVIEGGTNYTLTEALTDGSPVVPGDTIYMRLVDDGTGNPGSIVMEVLPDRPATPDVKVNPYDYAMNTTDDMEYSDDGGLTWNPCTENQVVENYQGETLLVRIAATDDSFHSDPCEVPVPVRGPAPVLSIDNATERLDCTSAMEYSYDGQTWIPCLDNMSLSNMTGEELLVRYSCDGTNPASNYAVIDVPTRNVSPILCVDTEIERLLAQGTKPEYLLEGNWVEIPASGIVVSDMCGQTLSVRESYDQTYFASLPVDITIPLRGITPNITVDRMEQTIDSSVSMEYSADNGSTWNACTQNMDVSGLAGKDILIRESATPTQFASFPALVSIPDYAATPNVELNTTDETLINTTTSLEYSLDGGETWQQTSEPLDVSDLTGETIIIRNPGKENEFPSPSVPVKIPERRDAPAVDIDNRAETVFPTAGTEWSSDGGETWSPSTEPLSVSEHFGETILVRYPATDDEFASDTTIVILPSRPGAPILVLDTEKETLNTTTEMEYSTDGGETWRQATEPLDVSNLTGQEILVRYPATDDTPASEITTVTVPSRQGAPDVTLDKDKGVITPTEGLEYSTDGGNTWKPCPDPMDITGLEGEDILIRKPADKDNLPSDPIVIHIPKRRPTPDVVIDYEKETVNTTPEMEYSTDGGKTWTPATEPLDVSNLAGQEILVRYPADDSHLPSNPAAVTVPARRAAPAVGHTDETRSGLKNGTLTKTDNTMEYRVSDGAWKAIVGNTVKDLAPGTYEVRYAATGSDMASAIQVITIAKGPSYAGGGGNSSSVITVHFDSDGGSKVKNQYLARNDRVDEPDEPTRDGYLFLGWYTDSKLTEEYDFRDKVTKSFTLYAKWEKVETTKPSDPAQIPASTASLLNKEDHIAYINGRTETLAAPTANITRGEVAAMIYRLLTNEAKAQYETSYNSFADVSRTDWYNTAISTLANIGIVTGYGNSCFGPDDNITRAELATILVRFCETTGSVLTDQFTDISGHWARAYINQAAKAGFVTGYTDQTFRPDQNITRAETVVMLNRILERSASAETVIPGYKVFDDISLNDWFYWDVIEAANSHDYFFDSVEHWTALT